ncbi:type II secretion system F family protein [bacterium]|nr:type II secretion system F family protein [bacterium]
MRDGRWKTAVLTRQLATLLQGGTNIVVALEVLGSQVDDARLGLILNDISGKLQAGYNFSGGLSCFPNVFSPTFVGLVRAGESSGQLEGNLHRLATMLEAEAILLRKVSSAMIYPLFVLATTVVLTLFLFYTVLPNFVYIFEEMHVPLPWITRLLMWATHAVRNPGAWLVAVGGLLHLAMLRKTPTGRAILYRFLQRVPLLGKALHYSALTRYCWIMESGVASGLPLSLAIRLAGEASGSPALEQDVAEVLACLQSGQPLSGHYTANSEIYSRLMGNLVALGEESSSLSTVLASLSHWFNEEADCRLQFFQATMEPALMAFVSLLVGTVVVGIFLPLYSFLGKLGV